MNHIVLPEDPERGLSFYLAAEESAAKDRNAGEAFFVWSVPPTVIVGRNQDIFSEVNIDYCREHGVDVVRRKSGGGCVYADHGNLMISYITRRGDVQDVFGRYLDRFVEALAALGIRAELSGRNDVLVDGFKVSGNAFRMLPDRCVVHGTLLYDMDFNAMSCAITPSETKLSAKGVASVRGRVANLKGYLEAAGHGDMDAAALREYLVDFFCDSHSVLTPEDVHEIENIEKTYRNPDFLYGRCMASDEYCRQALQSAHGTDGMVKCSGHIPGVGEIRIEMLLDNAGKIADVHLSGDYFLVDGMAPDEVDRRFAETLRGCVPVHEDIAARLGKMDLGSMVVTPDSVVMPDVIRHLVMRSTGMQRRCMANDEIPGQARDDR